MLVHTGPIEYVVMINSLFRYYCKFKRKKYGDKWDFPTIHHDVTSPANGKQSYIVADIVLRYTTQIMK